MEARESFGSPLQRLQRLAECNTLEGSLTRNFQHHRTRSADHLDHLDILCSFSVPNPRLERSTTELHRPVPHSHSVCASCNLNVLAAQSNQVLEELFVSSRGLDAQGTPEDTSLAHAIGSFGSRWNAAGSPSSVTVEEYNMSFSSAASLKRHLDRRALAAGCRQTLNVDDDPSLPQRATARLTAEYKRRPSLRRSFSSDSLRNIIKDIGREDRQRQRQAGHKKRSQPPAYAVPAELFFAPQDVFGRLRGMTVAKDPTRRTSEDRCLVRPHDSRLDLSSQGKGNINNCDAEHPARSRWHFILEDISLTFSLTNTMVGGGGPTWLRDGCNDWTDLNSVVLPSVLLTCVTRSQLRLPACGSSTVMRSHSICGIPETANLTPGLVLT